MSQLLPTAAESAGWQRAHMLSAQQLTANSDPKILNSWHLFKKFIYINFENRPEVQKLSYFQFEIITV